MDHIQDICRYGDDDGIIVSYVVVGKGGDRVQGGQGGGRGEADEGYSEEKGDVGDGGSKSRRGNKGPLNDRIRCCLLVI